MKKFITGLLTIGLIGILGACGSSEKSSAADDGREKITFWGSWSGAQVDQLNELIDKYNESQDSYTVTYRVQNNVEEKLLTGMAGGEIPDVVLWDRVNTSMYAEKNALLDLDDLIKKDNVDLSTFYEETVKEMQYDGKQFGMPLLVDNRSIFYNKKLLDEAGVQPPTTWAELLDVAKKTTKWDGNQLVQAGFSLDDVGLFNMWLQQAGGTMLTEDNTKTAFNSKAGAEVLDFWNQLLDAKVYQQGFSDGSDAFAAGKVALAYNGPWALADYDKVEGLDYGVVPPVSGPNGDKGALTGGFGLVIPKTAKNKDAAWDFIKWWTTNPEVGIEFAKISNWLPANKEAAQDSYFMDNEKYKAFVETMDFANIRPTVPGYSDLEKLAVNPQLENFISGRTSAEEALSNAQAQGDKILKEGSSE
ncbi:MULTISPECIES: ABC transporter substrate-binding protein [unclassified Enterococcus]|jgi:multiple sugar transport system substrate-binding protein|uniref:ABC transporter substrate-binding protein n=1 Tax=unclassified Enterococcus TaxID=2608891 RepID=UPI003D2DA39A